MTEKAFMNAVVKGEYDIVVSAMDSHPEWIDSRVHKWGSPPLCIAAWEQHPELVRFFLDRGADVHGCHEKWRWMAIHEASDRGNLEIIKMLVEAGADVNAKNYDQRTPLMMAMDSGNMEAVKYLIVSGAGVDCPNDEGWSFMHMAAGQGDIEMANMLMEKGVKIEPLNSSGQSPLFWASTAEMVDFLLAQGADIKRLDDTLQSPLHIAGMFGYEQAAESMLAAGVDINCVDAQGQTALNIARQEKRHGMIKLLVSRGAVAGKDAARQVRVCRDSKGTIYHKGKAILPFCVWQQPERLFEYNKLLGINWLIYQPMGLDGNTLDQTKHFLKTADSKDMFCVTHYRNGLEGIENIVGWSFDISVSPDRSYEMFRNISPQVLLVSNLSAGHFLRGEDAEDYKKRFERVDCLVTHVWPEMYEDKPRNLRLVGDFVDLVREYSRELPRGELAVIPDINCHNWRGPDGREYEAPTVEEFRFQVWLALIHGADGISLFPISFNPFVFNQMYAGLANKMPQLVAEVQQFTDVLTSDESYLNYTLSTANPEAILDVTTRRFGGDDYIFLLNGTKDETEITFAVDGLGKDLAMIDMLTGKPVEIKGKAHSEKLPGLELRIWKITSVK